MKKFRIFYTITKGYSEEVEAKTLDEAVEKWNNEADLKYDDNDGCVEYDPFTEEYDSFRM